MSPKRSARLDHALPFAATEVVREDAEPRPVRPREPRQHGPCEGRGRAPRARRGAAESRARPSRRSRSRRAPARSRRSPPSRGPAGSRRRSTRMSLKWTRRMSGPSARISVARSMPAHDDIGKVEVAAERPRCDRPGERPDPVGGQRALVAEHDVCVGRRSAHARKAPPRARGRLVVRARRGRRTGRGSRRPPSSGPTRSRARRRARAPRRRRIGVGDAAAVAVLAEHQARHPSPDAPARARATQPSREPSSSRPTSSSTPSNVSRRAASNTRPRAQGSSDRVHDADLHREPALARRAATSREPSSAERHAASVSSSERRLCRAELNGSRSSAIARASSRACRRIRPDTTRPRARSAVRDRRLARARRSPSRGGRCRESCPRSRAPRTGTTGRLVRASPTLRINAFAPSA